MHSKSAKTAEIAELKFRPLKKDLHHWFKQLRYATESGKLPDLKTVEQFLAGVTLMVSYPGFGDEFYSSFKAACDSLLPLLKSGDINSFEKQITTIHDLKKQCHLRFK
nr:GAK system XXXCH domain-containing protein [Desulfobulbaceae bacterium]